MSIRLSSVAAVLSLLLTAAAPAWSAEPAVAPQAADDSSSATGSAAGPSRERMLMSLFEDVISDVSSKVLPSVVFIEAIQKNNNRKAKVTGSGFIVSEDGLIVTNQHVVEKAQKVEVTLMNSRRKFRAEIVGADEQTDIAVLKIEPPGKLPAAKLGDYNSVRVGEGVLAIGNPYGLDGTVSFGIVSAKGRNLNVGSIINDFIQTDAMIDHGSSGGPLVNLKGEVIGVNSRGQGRGIGFTIPISTALEVRDRLVESGTYKRGWLGVTVQPLSRDLAEYFGKPDLKGAIVTHVIDTSPAARAGIRVEDIILEVNGTPIDTEDLKDLNEFRRVIAAIAPETRVKVNVQRAGRKKTLTVAIGEQPQIEGEEFETDFGFTVQEITTSMTVANRLASSEGVFVSFVEKGSVAAEASLGYSEVLQYVNDTRVRTLAEFRKAFEKADTSKPFLLKGLAGDTLRYHLLVPYGKGKQVVAEE